MIYWFLYPLHTKLSALNVLRYVPFRMLLATATAMLVTFGVYPWFIRRLQSKQIGQVVRSDGPQSHLSKAGTPTMGGALILLAVVVGTVLWADPTNAMVWVVTAITSLYGVIGWIDDARKIRKKSSGGLSGRYKLLLQFAFALGICAWLWYGESGLPADWVHVRNGMSVPFVSYQKWHIVLPAWAYVCFAAFVIVAMSNGVNLTDGLDGLAIGPVMINAATYMVFAYIAGAVFFKHRVAVYLGTPYIPSADELSVYCGAVLGAGFGFLWFNTYPAQVFMGDVGSLALGGGLGTLAVVTKNELLSVVLGGIFVLESVSVIGQVISFRLFKKRIFLMAPIHHHYEKKGWAEPKIIVRFWIISILLALVSLASLKVR